MTTFVKSVNPIKELTFMQRLVRGTLASMILIVPTYLGVKFISEPSSERMVANLTPEERRVFEERAVVTSQNLQHMINRSRETRGRMTQKDFEGIVSHAPYLKNVDTAPTGRTWPLPAPGTAPAAGDASAAAAAPADSSATK